MNTEKAKLLVKMLRDRFYGDELSDFEVVDKALQSCNSSSFAMLLLILYYQLTELWPDYVLLILVSCAAGMVCAFLYFKGQRRILLEARAHFTRHTPQNFEELEKLNEK
jgi:hypothetical protein